MEEAEQLCDYIVIMDQGIILKEGTKNDLLGENKTLDDLFIDLTGRHLNE
jgi:ABC-type multidrug transport system ATPase subunit